MSIWSAVNFESPYAMLQSRVWSNLSIPERGIGKSHPSISQSGTVDLGSGGTVEHGRLELFAAAIAAINRRSTSIALCGQA